MYSRSVSTGDIAQWQNACLAYKQSPGFNPQYQREGKIKHSRRMEDKLAFFGRQHWVERQKGHHLMRERPRSHMSPTTTTSQVTSGRVLNPLKLSFLSAEWEQ